MADRDRLRWLLRVFAEPPFLRLYVEAAEAYLAASAAAEAANPTSATAGAQSPANAAAVAPDAASSCDLRRFEDAFFALAPDIEHPPEAREEAWQLIQGWLPDEPFAPAAAFRAVLRGVASLDGGNRNDRNRNDDLADLCRFWSLPELFEPLGTSELSGHSSGYHELHCHLRGSVPYLHLWQSWINDERWRARLRTMPCQVGTWRRTWAELVQVAAACQQRLPMLSPLCDETQLMAQQLRFLAVLVRADDTVDEVADEADATQLADTDLTCAVAYLAVCTGLRRELLHQRGRAGLFDFTVAYAHYANVQKAPRRQRDELRALVPPVLRQFQASGARVVELRPTMDTTRIDMQHKFEAVLWGYFDYLARETSPPVLMALVPSLYKQEGHRDAQEIGDSVAWRIQSERWCEQVDGLLALIDELPALRYFVVGLDAAGRERGCPPRALAPAFARVRAYHQRHGLARAAVGRYMSVAGLRRLAQEHRGYPDVVLAELNQRPISRIRLGITVHAGEDFVDPMSGLRCIDESLTWLAPDRLGHALAAGLPRERVRALLERRSRQPGADVISLDHGRFRLRKPRGVHLLDLAWLHRVDPDIAARRLWATRLAEAAAGLTGAPVAAEWLAAQLTGATAPVTLFVPGIHFVAPHRVNPGDSLWFEVDDHWLDSIERLRRVVVATLQQCHIVVESCPTSNLAVAGLDQPPLLTLLQEGVPCVVATDDPGLFGAWPGDELARAPEQHHNALLSRAARASFVRTPNTDVA